MILIDDLIKDLQRVQREGYKYITMLRLDSQKDKVVSLFDDEDLNFVAGYAKDLEGRFESKGRVK